MKRLVCVIALMSIFIVPVSAYDADAMYKEQARSSGASELYGKTPDSAKSSLKKLDIDNPEQGSLSNFTPANLIKIIWENIKDAAKAPLKAVVTVFGILLICALLGTLKNSVGEKALGNVFDIVCALCIAAALALPILQTIRGCAEIIRQSAGFMIAFLPVFAALSTASGHVASATAFQGIMLLVCEGISQIAATTFVPLITIYLGFSVIGSVSPGININGIANFFKSFVNWGLGLCITIFTGVMTIQGLIAQAADTVTLKTAKYVVGSAVPVVGSTISDAMNTVVSCTNLLKTTTGAYAIVVLILAFLPAILSCLIWILAVELSGGVADVLGINHMSVLLKSFKNALLIMISLVFCCALALIISVSIMLMLGLGS
jgi:stage III sporulation protein AE